MNTVQRGSHLADVDGSESESPKKGAKSESMYAEQKSCTIISKQVGNGPNNMEQNIKASLVNRDLAPCQMKHIEGSQIKVELNGQAKNGS